MSLLTDFESGPEKQPSDKPRNVRRREGRVYHCQDCKAAFSGRGLYHRVRDHEAMTGHKMSKEEQLN